MKIEKTFSPTTQISDGTLTPQQDKQLREAAKMYEQHFMNEMIKAMRSTVHHDDTFLKKNFAEKIYEEQMDQKYAEDWSKRGGIGLQDMIYEQIKQKFFNKNQMPPPQGPIPIPKKPPVELKKGGLFLEADPTNEAALQILSPWDGKVSAIEKMDQGWAKVKIDHTFDGGQNMASVMTFQGHAPGLNVGDEVAAGQKLGKLNPERPILAWNLEWS